MKTKSGHLWVGLVTLAGSILSAQIALSQPKPLNPLVARAAQPRGAAPVECEDGLSTTPALRVDVSQVPAPAPTPVESVAFAPPNGSLRSALQDAQTALTQNDRATFDAALLREKAILKSYPAGNERRAAEEVVRLHDAASRLWDAQFESPYFSHDNPVYATANVFPGYADAVRRSVLTDASGQHFYPAAESRDFMARLAAERLKAMGVRVTTQPARNAPPPPAAKPRATATKPKARTTTKRSTTPPRKPAAVAASKPAPAPTPVAPTPAPPPPPPATATTTTAPADLAPITSIVSTTSATTSTETTATAVASSTDATASDTASTDTGSADSNVATDTAATTIDTASTDVAAPPAQGRSLLLPTILILLGLGVLVVLFRASN